jgi:hypothetical protein
LQQGGKEKNVENVERFTHKPVQHVELWPLSYGKENKAEMLQNIAHGRSHVWRFLMDFDTALLATLWAIDSGKRGLYNQSSTYDVRAGLRARPQVCSFLKNC